MATRPAEHSFIGCGSDPKPLPDAANDDNPFVRRWHQSGPPGDASVHATTEFLEAMWAACEPPKGTPCHLEAAYEGHRSKARNAHERAARLLVDGPRSANGTAFTTRRLRRLGEPMIEIDHMRVVPDLFVTPARPVAERRHEMLVLRRERCSFTRKRTDVRSAPGHLAISRHALERIHERSLIGGGDLRATVLDQAEEADSALAFAFAAGIHLGTNRLDRRAATAIPFCDGLLLVQNRIVALRRSANPADWQEISRGGRFHHPVAINPLTTVPVPDMYDQPMVGHVVPVAATYVSGDMMRTTQEGYRDWFLRMMSLHRSVMPDLAARTAKCVEHHRAGEMVEDPFVSVPDVGRRVLGEIVVQRPHQPILMSIGWTRFSHPCRW